jgi:hypothetical protein
MLEQYKKTFVSLQVTMWLVAALVAWLTKQPLVGVWFLATMQVGAVLGAFWGARLKRLR